jgi:hypothetical protein
MSRRDEHKRPHPAVWDGAFSLAQQLGLFDRHKREIIERGRHVAGALSSFNQAVDYLQGLFLNPNLAALRADLRRNILKEVQMRATSFLVGNRGGAEFTATHGA